MAVPLQKRPPGARRKLHANKNKAVRKNASVSKKKPMSLMHDMSEECVKSELDLFTIPLTQTAILKNTNVEVPLISPISDTVLLEFFITGNGEDYIDLNNTLLYTQLKITRPDGGTIADEATVGLINYPGAKIPSCFVGGQTDLAEFEHIPIPQYHRMFHELRQTYTGNTFLCRAFLQGYSRAYGCGRPRWK